MRKKEKKKKKLICCLHFGAARQTDRRCWCTHLLMKDGLIDGRNNDVFVCAKVKGAIKRRRHKFATLEHRTGGRRTWCRRQNRPAKFPTNNKNHIENFCVVCYFAIILYYLYNIKNIYLYNNNKLFLATENIIKLI
jgi:hypothetical protein